MINPVLRRFRGSLLRALPLALAAVSFPAVALAEDVAPAPPGTVVSRDDFSTTTKQNGEFHTRTFPEPVNFQNADGSWDPINRTLVRRSDGSVHPKDVDGDAAIPSDLEDPIRLEHGGRHISFQLLGADGGRDTAGSTASFDDAVPHADLKYRSLADGLKESIVLDSAKAQRVFSYAVVGGVDLSATIEGGELILRDSRGDAKFRVSAPLAWDSAEDKAYSNALNLSVTKQSAGHWTLTMRPDAKWLDDPARVYPVTLDPDFYWQGDGSERFHGANQDCYLSGGVQAAITYCAATTLAIGYYNRPYRANLRFDLASAIPSYANITNAQLAMFLPGSSTHAAINSRVHTITSDWDNTATWNNRKTNTPWSTSGGGGDVSSAANLTGTVNPSVGNANYWYYWNTPLDTVNGWIKGTLPNYGIQVSADSEVAATNAYSFVSTDGNQASWPALDVTWVPDTTAPTGVTPAPGVGVTDKSYVKGSQSFVINASAQDDLSGVKKLELLRDDVNVAATAAVACPSNTCPLTTSQALTLDPTGLSEGAHTLALRATDAAGNVTTTSKWTIYVDRTAPAPPVSVDSTLDDSDGEASVGWDASVDPALTSTIAGSGTANYSIQYKMGAGAWSAATPLTADEGPTVDVGPSSVGQAVQYAITSVDLAGNSSVSTGTVTTAYTDITASMEGDAAVSDPPATPTFGDGETALARAQDPNAIIESDPPSTDPTATQASYNAPDEGTAYSGGTGTYAHNQCSIDNYASPCGAYKGRQAGNYAKRWAHTGGNGSYRNFDYNYFPQNEGDCTNFASQAIHFGGVRFARTAPGINDPRHDDSSLYYKGTNSWWSHKYKNTFGQTKYGNSFSWSVAPGLYKQLLDTGIARVKQPGERLQTGDLIFYHWNDKDKNGVVDHAITHVNIVAEVRKRKVYIAQHTSDRFMTVRTWNSFARGDHPDFTREILRPVYTRFDLS